LGWAAEKLVMVKETNKTFEVVIIGLGKTGYSSACFLAKQNINFAVTDNRESPPMLEAMQKAFPAIPLYLGEFDKELLMNANELLISPGVSMKDPTVAAAIQSGVKVYGDVEIFCRHINASVVAITGSNGKSTVTSLIAEMAKSAGLNVIEGGNIGTPVFNLLEQEEPDIYVLELSSFQLETVSSLNAAAAAVLNISEDHLERYSDLAEYANAKARIYAGNGTMVINVDDDHVAAMTASDRNSMGFTLGEPKAGQYGTRIYDKKSWLVKADEKLIAADQLQIRGKHNVANALAALALAEAINLPREAMLNVLKTFPGLPHRCQWVAKIKDVDWYNDSKGTNVAACCAAITGLTEKENIILIAGGEAKGANFSQLAEVAKGRVRSAIVIGRDGYLIKSALQDLLTVYEADTIESAVRLAAEITTSGDLVLLSPACASFDMYEDYQARGNAFTRAVAKLKN
jgi:UDP-N-acetylmuramoylalanine--D-glutamate ligase